MERIEQIQQEADKARAAGDTQLADAIEASLVTTAPQREAALVPRQVPAGASDIDQLKHSLFSEAAEDARSMGDDMGAQAFWRFLPLHELPLAAVHIVNPGFYLLC